MKYFFQFKLKIINYYLYMESILNLSPLDGRYVNKTKELRPFFLNLDI